MLRNISGAFILIYIILKDCIKFNFKTVKITKGYFLRKSRKVGLKKYQRHMDKKLRGTNDV